MNQAFDMSRELTAGFPFLLATQRQAVPYTPVWFMRQAGRYQASYRKVREKFSLLEICRTPEVATQVTLQPIQDFGFDAAILFSDITIPYYGFGIPFDIKPGVGPVVEQPIRTAKQISQLTPFDVHQEIPYVFEAIRMLRKELSVPLIGFSGAPFTLAAYLVEGRPRREFTETRKLMYREPALWNDLMARLVRVTVDYLTAQVEAGAQALQVFDSWVGGLHPRCYQQHLLPHMRTLFSALEGLGVPLIHFGTSTASLLPLLKQAGGDVIGVDWKTPLEWAWNELGDGVAVQGNLDPAVLFSDFEMVKEAADQVLKEASGRPGHIFNLGHGILPETPEDNVKRLVEYVHEVSVE